MYEDGRWEVVEVEVVLTPGFTTTSPGSGSRWALAGREGSRGGGRNLSGQAAGSKEHRETWQGEFPGWWGLKKSPTK